MKEQPSQQKPLTESTTHDHPQLSSFQSHRSSSFPTSPVPAPTLNFPPGSFNWCRYTFLALTLNITYYIQGIVCLCENYGEKESGPVLILRLVNWLTLHRTSGKPNLPPHRPWGTCRWRSSTIKSIMIGQRSSTVGVQLFRRALQSLDEQAFQQGRHAG